MTGMLLVSSVRNPIAPLSAPRSPARPRTIRWGGPPEHGTGSFRTASESKALGGRRLEWRIARDGETASRRVPRDVLCQGTGGRRTLRRVRLHGRIDLHGEEVGEAVDERRLFGELLVEGVREVVCWVGRYNQHRRPAQPSLSLKKSCDTFFSMLGYMICGIREWLLTIGAKVDN